MKLKACIGIGFLITMAQLLLGPYTNYSPIVGSDAWFPTGYFVNFTDLLWRTGPLYYVSRLPYTLPGIATYLVFTPKVANFLLNLASLGVSITALLVIASRGLDRRWAVALAILFVTNAYLLTANLSDYPDGPAVAYFLAGYAIASDERHWLSRAAGALLAIGACWMCAFLTNMIIGLLIAPAAFYVMLYPRPSRQEVIFRAATMLLGAVLILLPLMVVSRFVLGVWFFPAPQISQLVYAAERPNYLPDMWGRGTAWLAGSYRLVALYGPMLVGTACLFSRRLRTPDFVATLAMCVAAGLFFVAAELADKVLLRAPRHSSYLIAFSFILTIKLVQKVASGQDSAPDERYGPFVMALLSVTATFVLSHTVEEPHATWIILGVGVILLAAAILVPGLLKVRATATALAAFMVLNLSTGFDLRVIYTDTSDVFTAVMNTQSLLASGHLRHRKLQFWFDQDDPQWAVFQVVVNLYTRGYYIDFTAKLPAFNADELREYMPPGVVVIHLCSAACPLEARDAVMRSVGIGPLSSYSWRVSTDGGTAFNVIMEDTQPNRGP